MNKFAEKREGNRKGVYAFRGGKLLEGQYMGELVEDNVVFLRLVRQISVVPSLGLWESLSSDKELSNPSW